MTVTMILFQAALWLWFLGCVTTYRIGKYLLVEGMGMKSAEFIMLCLYSIGPLSCWSGQMLRKAEAGHGGMV